jgi:predicted regulator of Ras-like GTPase activity (Roadblock/LC7/MglB family)
MTSPLSSEAHNLAWLVQDLVERVPAIRHAVVVSTDGLLLVRSNSLDRPRAEQLSAVGSAFASLANSSGRYFDGGDVMQTMVQMSRGFLFVHVISDGSCLVVLSAAGSDVGLVGYEMAMLVRRVGDLLTPALRAELQAALPR